MSMFNYINNLGERIKFMVMLSKVTIDSAFSRRLDPVSIKNMLSEELSIITPIDYTGCEETEDLYEDLLRL